MLTRVSSCGEPSRRPLPAPPNTWRVIWALLVITEVPEWAFAQIVRGAVSSAVGSGRAAGAVVLLIDSALTTHARVLTTDGRYLELVREAHGAMSAPEVQLVFPTGT
jgi:hypothetical protein